MNKQTLILTIILLIPLVLAVDIYSGNSYSFQSEQFDYYDVIGNSSNMDGMNITWESGNTTISFHQLFKPDNFTLTFWKDDKPITVYQNIGSGGSSRTIYKDRNITKYKIFETNKTINIPYNCTKPIDIIDLTPKRINWIELILRILRGVLRF